MKSVRTEKRSYRASAATIAAKFRWDNNSPNPTDESADTVPPSAGGRLKLRFVLMVANHAYGATLKVQPDGLAGGCPALAGCCARAPNIAPAVSSPARTTAITIRRSIRGLPHLDMIGPFDPVLSSATFAKLTYRSANWNRARQAEFDPETLDRAQGQYTNRGRQPVLCRFGH